MGCFQGKRPRCAFAGCGKLLSGPRTDILCRCKKAFCHHHSFPEAHHCTFDYRTAAKKDLEASNPKIEGDKFDKLDGPL